MSKHLAKCICFGFVNLKPKNASHVLHCISMCNNANYYHCECLARPLRSNASLTESLKKVYNITCCTFVFTNIWNKRDINKKIQNILSKSIPNITKSFINIAVTKNWILSSHMQNIAKTIIYQNLSTNRNSIIVFVPLFNKKERG